MKEVLEGKRTGIRNSAMRDMTMEKSAGALTDEALRIKAFHCICFIESVPKAAVRAMGIF